MPAQLAPSVTCTTRIASDSRRFASATVVRVDAAAQLRTGTGEDSRGASATRLGFAGQATVGDARY